MTVKLQHMTAKLTILGTISPGKMVPVIAPFDGVVSERRVHFGDRVNAGDILAVLDADEIESRLREAQSALLKATMLVDALNRWETSPDMSRAKRALEAAEVNLTILERQVTETKRLLDLGIVSRNEHDSLTQQRDAQLMAVASATEDLRAIQGRGSTDNRRLADIDELNAKTRLESLQRQIDGAIVSASTSGVLMRPPLSAQAVQGSIVVEPGARLSRGQPMFVIADTETLAVIGKVDEVDVNQIWIGQPVTISGDAFLGESFGGRITSVSAEAQDMQGGRGPSFDVRALFSGNGEVRRALLRIGMSAKVAVEIRSNPQAIIVPIEAVQNAETKPIVKVFDSSSGEARERAVTLGTTNEIGIEILAGLGPGDVVILPP